MTTIHEQVSRLVVAATIDDVNVPQIVNAVHRLDKPPPGADEIGRVLHFVGVMLDHGFVAVTSPYDDPPSQPWPEKDKAAVLRRLRHEWEALDHQPTFADLCWFHRSGPVPDEMLYD